MLGEYGCAMRTEFNGFGDVDTIIVGDEPMATLYKSVAANDIGIAQSSSANKAR